MKRILGFTLIELMVTIAALAILAAIALPSYTAYVVRGKLAEATSSLSDFRVRMEQYYQDNRNYGAGGCGVAAPTGKYFGFACALGGTNQLYAATATSVAGQGLGTAGSYVYTINQNGTQGTTTFAGAAGPATEWKTR